MDLPSLLQAKLKAEKIIEDLFQRPEDLDKIPQLKTQFILNEEAAETQLRLAIETQLDGVQYGLKKLDTAFLECSKIQERMEEISEVLIDTRSLSNGVKEFLAQISRQNQLVFAKKNMDYLVKVPEMMREADALLDKDEFLQAHKIVEELEGTRDEIMRELHKQDTNETDLRILDSFFCDMDKLNKRMLQHIQFMGESIMNAAVTQNVILVTCNRIVDREEQIDELCMSRKSSEGYMPANRPKSWKNEFLKKVKFYIRQKIFDNAVDEKMIRDVAIKDLTLAKNILVVYFHPDYKIFEEFVSMFHDIICEYVDSKANQLHDDTESFRLMCWINSFYTEDNMISPQLDVEFLSKDQLNKVIWIYLEQQKVDLRFCFNNYLINDAIAWESDQLPPLDGYSMYHTSIGTMMLQQLTEILGKGKVLVKYVREDYYKMFLEVISNFQYVYIRRLKMYRRRYLENDSIKLSLEYMVANCNNCLKLKMDLEELISKDLEDSHSIMDKINSRLKELGKKMLSIAQECLNFIKEKLFKDLSKIIADDLVSESFRVSDYIFRTLTDNDVTLVHLIRPAYTRFISIIADQIMTDYNKNLITK